ncbi:Pentatricopeptide repeat-containing protein At4g01400, mitochondrial [Linum grandiflorum]
MNPPFLRSSKTAISAAVRHVTVRPNAQPSLFYSSYQKEQQFPVTSTSLIGSPSRVQKLIASQSDPLLAKEIFDYASRQPNFKHSYSAYLVLILKLGKSKHFSLIDAVVADLRSKRYPVTSQLFSYLIRIYGDAGLLDKVTRTFHTMREFDFKPSPKHLNLILELLVARRSYVKPAYDLFREAKRQGLVAPNTKSYNILMRAMCLNDELSIAYKLFNEMPKRDVVPDVESYRILMQALCRKSQVNGAVNLLEDMLNKGFVPDSLTYTTLLNSLCRKTKLREAYKLLCRMKVKGCNPDIVHYNTVILGFCREGRAMDACKVLEDMEDSNLCLPNVVSYRTLVAGLCDQGMIEEAKGYLLEMLSKEFSPHFSVADSVVKGLCGVGKIEEACGVVEELLKHGEGLHLDTWKVMVPRVCNGSDEELELALDRVKKLEIKGDTRIVDAGAALEDYLINMIQNRRNRG